MGTAIHYCRVSGKRISAEDFFRGDAVEWKGYTYSKAHVPDEAREAQRRGKKLLPADLMDEASEGSALTRRLSDSGKLPRRGVGAASGRAPTPSARNRVKTSSRRRPTGQLARQAPEEAPPSEGGGTGRTTPVPSVDHGRVVMLRVMISAIVLGVGATIFIIAFTAGPSAGDSTENDRSADRENGGESETMAAELRTWLDEVDRVERRVEDLEERGRNLSLADLAQFAEHRLERIRELEQEAQELASDLITVPEEATQRLEGFRATVAEYSLAFHIEEIRHSCWERLEQGDLAGASRLIQRVAEGSRPDLLPGDYLGFTFTEEQLGEVEAEVKEFAEGLRSLSEQDRQRAGVLLSLRRALHALSTDEMGHAQRGRKLDALHEQLAEAYDESLLEVDRRASFLGKLYGTVIEPLSVATRQWLRAELRVANRWSSRRQGSYEWVARADRLMGYLPPGHREAQQLAELVREADLPLYERARGAAQDFASFAEGREHLEELLALPQKKGPRLFAEAREHPSRFPHYHRAMQAVLEAWSTDLLETAAGFERFGEDIANLFYRRSTEVLEHLDEAQETYAAIVELRGRAARMRPAPAALGGYGRLARQGIAPDADWAVRAFGYAAISFLLHRFPLEPEHQQYAEFFQNETLTAALAYFTEQKEAGFENEEERLRWRVHVEFLRSFVTFYGDHPDEAETLSSLVATEGDVNIIVLNGMIDLYGQLRGDADYGRSPTRKLWPFAHRIGVLAKPLAQQDPDSEAANRLAWAQVRAVNTFQHYRRTVSSKGHADLMLRWAKTMQDEITPEWLPQSEQAKAALQDGIDSLTTAYDELGPSTNPFVE